MCRAAYDRRAVPLTIIDEGLGNQVIIDAGVREAGDGAIVLGGDGNTVHIAAGCTTIQFSLRLGAGCSFRAGWGCRLAGIEAYAANHGVISIGDSSNFTGHTRIYLHEPGRIEIGRACLVGSDTLLMNSDMHSIIDLDGGGRINPARDVVVGDDVWLAANVTVLKGSTIGRGSVVGFGAVVTGSLPPHSLSAGSPARVIRERIAWRPDLI